MSSLYVRSLCDQWAKSAETNTGIPYFSTINEEQNPTDRLWFTLLYQPVNTTQATYCSTWETGIVSLIFMGPAGSGFEETLLSAQPVIDDFVASVDATGRLTLEVEQPPSDFTSPDDPWYVVEVAINYTLR